jgi:BASS family bile acid:Na+ symporter
MLYRARNPIRARLLEPRLKRFSLIMFFIVVVAAVTAEWHRLTESFGSVAPAALALNVAAMTVSFAVARLARLPDRQATAISMELGVHNSTLSIAVATSITTQLAIPAAVYSAFMFFTAGAFVRIMARRNLAAERLAPAPGIA